MSIKPINTPGIAHAARGGIRPESRPAARAKTSEAGVNGPRDEAKVSANARRMLAQVAKAEFKLQLSPRELQKLIKAPTPPGAPSAGSED